MTGPPRHGPTRPPIPHHPSVAPFEPRAGTRVTCEDLGTGETETIEIANDYLLVVDGSCYEAGIQVHSNGTHVITIKGRKR